MINMLKNMLMTNNVNGEYKNILPKLIIFYMQISEQNNNLQLI
jgi:hypothetical protein